MRTVHVPMFVVMMVMLMGVIMIVIVVTTWTVDVLFLLFVGHDAFLDLCCEDPALRLRP